MTLASAFLMEMLSKATKKARDWLIADACHRTGTHLREVESPFSRLRLALSRLWLAYPCWFVRRERLNLEARWHVRGPSICSTPAFLG